MSNSIKITPIERDACIWKQTTQNWHKGIEYHYLTSQGRLVSYFNNDLPFTPSGWLTRAASPNRALPNINPTQPDRERRSQIVIDPWRILSILERYEGNDWWERVNNFSWLFCDARCIVPSGRIMVMPDGEILRFQERLEAVDEGRKCIRRASLYMHRDIYTTIWASEHARTKLTGDIEGIEAISQGVTQVVSQILSNHNLKREDVEKIITDFIWRQGSQTRDISQRNFYIRKMFTHYLLKLGASQYRSMRIFWALETLKSGIRDRWWKSSGINIWRELTIQAKDLELYYWKNCIFWIWWSNRVDISQFLDSLDDDDKFWAFKKRIQNYTPRKSYPIFEPFKSFYREWQEFLSQSWDKNLAKRILIRQYTLTTLFEAKILYLYDDDSRWIRDASFLNRRMATLSSLPGANNKIQMPDFSSWDIHAIRELTKQAIQRLSQPLL